MNGDVLRRAALVDEDAVPEPWDHRDDGSSIEAVASRDYYRTTLNLTDDQGRGEIPAYVWDFSRAPTIPQNVRDGWTRSSSGRVLGDNDKYVSKASDVPRLQYEQGGGAEGLLVEAHLRTNQVLNSADITQWTTSGGTNGVSTSSATSIIEGETAHEVTGGGAADDHASESAGTFSDNDEAAYVKVERGTSDKIALEVYNTSTSSVVARVEYDWANDTTNVASGSVADDNVRSQQSNGGNGGEQVHFQFRIAGGNGENTGGENRQVRFYPDRNGNGNTAYFHHAQIEEAHSASSPIVTGGSATTRSADDYKIFSGGQPEWWNPNEGTFLLDFKIRSFSGPRSASDDILVGTDPPYFFFDKTDRISTFVGGSDLDAGTPNRYQIDNAAISWDDNGVAIALNGQSKFRSVNDPRQKDPGNDLFLGGLTPLAVFALKYIPRALSESTLKSLTA